MPLIDLKNVEVYFEDGTSEAGAVNNSMTGAVNNVSGYNSGATSILVDGFTGQVPVGSALTINSVAGFRVTSTTETGGNTTTINFTPALSASVADDDVVSVSGFAVGATAIIVDGFTGQLPVGARIQFDGLNQYQIVSTTETGDDTTAVVITPGLVAVAPDDNAVTVYGVFIKIKVGEGTITWTENKPREYKLDRGRLDQVRNADEVPMDVNFTLAYEELTASDPSTDPPTPEDVLKRVGAAANWVSVNTADPCAPYCINIRLVHTPPCPDFHPEQVILPQYYYEKLDHSPKDATITTSGKCNALSALVTRLVA